MATRNAELLAGSTANLQRAARRPTRHPLQAVLVTLMMALLCGCGGGDADDAPADNGDPGGQTAQQQPGGERNGNPPASEAPGSTPTTQEEAVVAALNEAVRMLEEQRYREFIDAYVPVDELRGIREAGIDQAIADIQSRPEQLAELLTMLRQAQKATPRLNASKTEASFGVDMPEATAEPPVVQAMGPSGTSTGTGYEGELPAVIDQAMAALEGGDVAEFVERMFPLPELARLRATEQLATEIERLQAMPELIQRMLNDLRTLKEHTPEYQDSGNVAIYTIPRGTVEFGRRQTELAPREVRFQKVGGHWRLYDHTQAVHEEIVRQSQADMARSTFVVQLTMERIGNDWRLAPKSRQSGRPQRRRAEPAQPARATPPEGEGYEPPPELNTPAVEPEQVPPELEIPPEREIPPELEIPRELEGAPATPR